MCGSVHTCTSTAAAAGRIEIGLSSSKKCHVLCTRSRVPPKLEQLLSPARFSRHAQARARRAGGGGTSHPPTDFLAAGRTSTLPPQDEARCEEVEDNIPWSSPLRPWESRKLETANCRRSFTMSGVGNVVHKLIAGCASACCARSNCAATVCLPPPLPAPPPSG